MSCLSTLQSTYKCLKCSIKNPEVFIPGPFWGNAILSESSQVNFPLPAD